MKKDILLLMLCLFCSIGAMAQTKTITGVVSDAAGEQSSERVLSKWVQQMVPLLTSMVNLY